MVLNDFNYLCTISIEIYIKMRLYKSDQTYFTETSTQNSPKIFHNYEWILSFSVHIQCNL